MLNNTSPTNGTLTIIRHADDEDNSLIQKIIVVYSWIMFIGLCETIAMFGIGTNVINIMCFVKQGFKDPVNVSLFGMAIADLVNMTLLLWTNMCLSPVFRSSNVPFEPVEVQFLVTGLPHATFANIAGWITALITLERCMCITSPLKIKTLITPKRVAIIVMGVFLVLLFGQTPMYVVNRLGLRFTPSRNRSILGILQIPGGNVVQGISFIINNTCLPFCAFIAIIICTVTLVIQLQLKTKWRKQATSSSSADNVSSRNQKVSKMVIMISTLFITCFTPICCVFIAMAVFPEFTITGKYKDYVLVMSGLGICLESVNSSSNIFIYYQMSSKYKTTLQQLFFKKES